MTDCHEQRVCVKFCVKLGKTFTETLEILKQAFINESMVSETSPRPRKRAKFG